MKEILQQFKQNYLIKYWNPVAAVIAAGLISAYYFGVTGTYWAVTGEFTRWGGHALQALGVDVSDWSYYKIIGMQGTIFTRIDGVMILGMFAGCISAALWANNVKWRNQPHKRRIVQALIGGALAGFGARLAMGCNLASLFTGIPQFSVHDCHCCRYLRRRKSHLTSDIPREIRIEKRRSKITRNRSETSKSSFLDWYGRLFCLPNRFTLCDDKLYQTWLCDALWFSFRFIN